MHLAEASLPIRQAELQRSVGGTGSRGRRPGLTMTALDEFFKQFIELRDAGIASNQAQQCCNRKVRRGIRIFRGNGGPINERAHCFPHAHIADVEVKDLDEELHLLARSGAGGAVLGCFCHGASVKNGCSIDDGIEEVLKQKTTPSVLRSGFVLSS